MKKYLYPVLIFLIVLFLFWANYLPGTYLSGWDNLHPEFNFFLNIKRSLFAVWQEYQGLGLLGGMGHAADLPRQLFLGLSSVFIPVSLIRYFYHSLMLFLGSLGCYFLLKEIVFVKKAGRELASFIGSIFYLLNLATVQMFSVPFEAFSSHFAFLPWLFWANLGYLKKGNWKSLALVGLVHFLALTQCYVPTLFFVYLAGLFLVFLFFFYQKESLKRILLILVTIFIINSFWLLPNFYFIASNTKINTEAKINQMATEDNLAKNRKYGTLKDVALLKGFWFDNVEINQEGQAVYQLESFVNHLESPWIRTIGYSLFALSFLGMLFALAKKDKNILSFLPVSLFTFTFLASQVPVFSFLNQLFYKLPFSSQVFRFPFTKFSILASFCLALFFAFAFLSLAGFLKNQMAKGVLVFIFILLPIVFLWPVFQGELFYHKVKAQIPKEYFEVFEFFKNQDPNTRIANFPQHRFWGWNFYRFNYSGSGFLWYGIKQPMLDRAFDVWSDKNENYYWEISYALYSQNLKLFEAVLEKYQINWLLVDENVTSFNTPHALYFDELEEIARKSDKIKHLKTFGKIKIYKVNLKTPVKNFVFLAQNLPVVEPSYKWNNFDQAFLDYNHYFSPIENWKLKIENYYYYPFRSLFTGRSQENLEFEIEETGDFFIFKKTLPETTTSWVVKTPKPKEEIIFVNPDELSQTQTFYPEVYLNNQTLKVFIPKVEGYYSATIKPESDTKEAKDCSNGQVENKIVKEEGKLLLRLSAINTNNCSASFWLPNLSHNFSYLITVKSRNIKGKSLVFWLENLTIKKPDIETYLPKNQALETSYFIQPPMQDSGLGYSLHFDNISIGPKETINDLSEIRIYPLPFKFLTSLKLVKDSSDFYPQTKTPGKVYHPNPSLYLINSDKPLKTGEILGLSQAFDKGWVAYQLNNKFSKILPFFGQRLKNHVLINNWANGWILGKETKEPIVILFWPQYLEYSSGFFGVGFWQALLVNFFPQFSIFAPTIHRYPSRIKVRLYNPFW